MQHETQVKGYLSINMQRLIPYREANLRRLQDGSPRTRPVSKEIKQSEKFKDKAPGESGIRKTLI